MKKLGNVICLLIPEKDYGATLLQSSGLNSLGQVSLLLELCLFDFVGVFFRLKVWF